MSQTDRRSFLVFMGGISIGSFFIPGRATQALSEATAEAVVQSTAVAGPSGNVIELLIAPQWGAGYANGERVPLIVYIDGDGETMLWWPGDDEELAEMERFYDATRTPGRPEIDPETIFPLRRDDQEQALIDAIVANRDDDAPRLNYAKWLERRGDARGELIQLQCEYAKLEGTENPRKEALWNRQEELAAAHAGDWWRPLAAIGIWPSLGTDFCPLGFMDRGMIESVWILNRGVLPKHAERLWQAAPTLSTLRLCTRDTNVPAICKLPQLNGICELEICNEREFEFQQSDMEAICRSPNLTSLQSLELPGPFTDETIGVLCASSLLGQLKALELNGAELSARAVSMLATCRNVTALETLKIRECEIDATTARQLASSKHLHRLRSLKLDDAGLDNETFARLIDGEWPSLRELDLAGNPLGDAAARILADAKGLKNLESLSLAGAEMGDEGAKAIAASSWSARLKHLDYPAEELTDEGREALSAAFGDRVNFYQTRS